MENNHKLIEELQAARQGLIFINEFTRQAMSIQEVHGLWPLLADHLGSFFACDRVTCYLKEGDKVFSLHAQGLGDPVVLNISGAQASGQKIGIAGKVVCTGKVYSTNSPYSDVCFNSNYDERTGYKTENVLAAAIFHEKRVLGAVELLNKKNGFTEQDAQVMEKLSPQIGFVFDKLQADYEKKRLEDKAASTSKMEAVGDLAASTAHELASPIMNIITTTQIASMRLPLESELQSSLTAIEEEAHRCQHIITRLMQLVPRQSINLGAIHPHEVVQVVLSGLSREIALRGITLEKKFPKDLPGIHADGFLLQQVLKQIVSNAMLAMPKGGKLTVSAQVKDSQYFLSISDTGEGVDAKDMEHIFEPFFKFKYSGENAELELAACKGILQSMGGNLQAHSAGLGQGLTFTLVLSL